MEICEDFFSPLHFGLQFTLGWRIPLLKVECKFFENGVCVFVCLIVRTCVCVCVCMCV